LKKEAKTFVSGEVALITGASRGIGRATALQLAAEGAHVVLVARTQGALEEVDDEIRAAGGTATLLPLDMKAADSIDPIGPSLHARFGRLDILIHNAGALGKLTPAAHITPKDFAECVAINLTATYRLIRTCAPILLAAPAGRAIFVTSPVTARLLGRLRGHQSRHGEPGPQLGRRGRKNPPPRQPLRSRPNRHPHARPGVPRRRPQHPSPACHRSHPPPETLRPNLHRPRDRHSPIRIASPCEANARQHFQVWKAKEAVLFCKKEPKNFFYWCW